MRALIGVITADVHEWCLDRFSLAVKAMPPSYDLAIVENSAGEDYLRKLMAVDWGRRKVCIMRTPHFPPDGTPYFPFRTMNMAANRLIRFFNDEGYDWMLNLESDVLAPPDTLERLSGAFSRDFVTSALYFLRWDAGMSKLGKVLEETEIFPCVYENALDTHHSYKRLKFVPVGSIKGLMQVFGAGAGCFAAPKRAMDIDLKWFPGFPTTVDVTYSLMWQEKGIPVYVDGDFKVAHMKAKGDV